MKFPMYFQIDPSETKAEVIEGKLQILTQYFCVFFIK